MPRKVFNVTVEFDLHAVSCPGVWLCPKGKVSLRIVMLDSSAETSDIEPAFPLLIHETFTFTHTFRRVRYLQDLAQLFSGQLLSIQLIQWGQSLTTGNILATFETSLEELLYPSPPCRALLPGVDVDLLMEPTEVFPGIIAPKMEVSTRTIIEESLTSSTCEDGNSVFPKTLLSKTAGAQHKRQRRVCHTRGIKVNQSRLSARSCLVRRDHAWRGRSPCSNGNRSISSLTSLQRLIWEATSRDIHRPLADGVLTQRGHQEESVNADTEEAAGKSTVRTSDCYHETLAKDEPAPCVKDSCPTQHKPRQSEMRSCQTSKARRSSPPVLKETLRGRARCSSLGRDCRWKGPLTRKQTKRDPPSPRETRHNVTPRSRDPTDKSQLDFGLASFSPNTKRLAHGSRRTACAACACEASSTRGGSRCAGCCTEHVSGCTGMGDGAGCVCTERHHDPCTTVRTAIRSRRPGTDNSYRESFYRNLEKFYKRLYDQAVERKNRCSC